MSNYRYLGRQRHKIFLHPRSWYFQNPILYKSPHLLMNMSQQYYTIFKRLYFPSLVYLLLILMMWLLISMEKMVIEQQILVDLPVLRKRPQSRSQRLNVLQSHPMLVQLFVHPVHIRDDAISLHMAIFTLVLRWMFSCFIRLASYRIFDSICLSQPRSKESFFMS